MLMVLDYSHTSLTPCKNTFEDSSCNTSTDVRIQESILPSFWLISLNPTFCHIERFIFSSISEVREGKAILGVQVSVVLRSPTENLHSPL
ncbi:hypothetical protein PO909_018709 [Leuciscus waleckii]